MERSPCDQRELTPFRDRRPAAEDGIVLALDGIKNFLASSAEKLDIDGQFAADSLDERQALFEPLAGTSDFETNQLTELRRVVLLGNVGFGNAESSQAFERKVYPAFVIVDTDVLPEV